MAIKKHFKDEVQKRHYLIAKGMELCLLLYTGPSFCTLKHHCNDVSVQDCHISIANGLGTLQEFCTYFGNFSMLTSSDARSATAAAAMPSRCPLDASWPSLLTHNTVRAIRSWDREASWKQYWVQFFFSIHNQISQILWSLCRSKAWICDMVGCYLISMATLLSQLTRNFLIWIKGSMKFQWGPICAKILCSTLVYV